MSGRFVNFVLGEEVQVLLLVTHVLVCSPHKDVIIRDAGDRL